MQSLVDMEPRIGHLMQTRVDSPRRATPDVARAKPWHWHVFVYVQMFILQATWRSVVGAIGKYAIRRPMAWVWTNGYMVATTLASRGVGPGEYAARERICDECGQRVVASGHDYCRACGCPRWVLSRLEYKNRRGGHNCPLGLHSGSVAIRRTGQPEGR